VSDRLALAQSSRAARAADLLDRRIESMLDAIGLSEANLTNLAVSPADRQKLKGILARLARQKHPFSQCMTDLAKHRPDLSDESRRQICGRLKSMIKGTGRVKALSLSDEACPLIDPSMFALLEHVDDAALELFVSGMNEEASR
jgi:hypothetical protein